MHNGTNPNIIYGVLISTCGASEHFDQQNAFCYSLEQWRQEDHVHIRFPFEYRFQGALGFGGKYREQHDGHGSVNCYPEDETLRRQAMIAAANAALRTLRASASVS